MFEFFKKMKPKNRRVAMMCLTAIIIAAMVTGNFELIVSWFK